VSTRRLLRHYERGLALALGLVWLGAGVAGLFLGVAEARWLVIAIAAFAIYYGLTWLRVAARARLLEPGEMLMPWRVSR
jgi:hypothetical protein